MRCLVRRPGPPWCGNPGHDTRGSNESNEWPASARLGHRGRGQQDSRGRAQCRNWTDESERSLTGESGGWGAASCGHWRLVTSLSGRCHESCIAGAGGRGWCTRPGSSGGSGGCPRSRSSLRGPGGSHTARTAWTPRTRTGSEVESRGQRPDVGAWLRLCPRTL